MSRSLLTDITRVADVDVSILRDPALGAIYFPAGSPRNATVVPFHKNEEQEIVLACIHDADAVWPMAAESNGVLESIAREALRQNKILLGCTPDAIRLTASKYRTSQALRIAGITVVPTYRAQATLPPDQHAWVVKPDDGAGCSDTHIFSHPTGAKEWITAQKHADYVLQPYLSGRSCSLSLLCGNDEVVLLGCNDQRVAMSDNQFHYMGSTVNSIDDSSGELERLARRVVAAIPGLWGYVGIDLILTDHGPVVLEVNPRMTMSHAGLHASIGSNPAEMLFDMLHSGRCGLPPSQKSRQVSVDINACQHRARPSGSMTH